MNRKLILVFKTNNYLRAIDNKLGTPLNTFKVLNEMTWEVFNAEIISQKPFLERMRSRFEYTKIDLYFKLLKFWYSILETLGLKER